MGTSGTFGGSKSGLVPSWVDEPASTPAKAPAGDPPTAKDRIRHVQELLARKGFDAGTTNGEMSSRTANAIRLYQLRHGLPVNGIVSKQLMEHLQKGMI